MAADKTKQGTGYGVATSITKCCMSTASGMPIALRGSNKIEYLAIHYTAGGNSVAGYAKTVAAHFNKSGAKASADFVVDDGLMVQVNPNPEKYYCYAVGPVNSAAIMHGAAKNCNSISIEVCSTLVSGTSGSQPNHKGWYYTQGSLNNALQLARTLMKQYNIPISNVIRHYAVSGKLCPGIIGWNNGEIRDAYGNKTGQMNNSSQWGEFKKKLQDNTWYGNIDAPVISDLKVSNSASSGSGSTEATSVSAITNVSANTYQNIMPAIDKSVSTPIRLYKAIDPTIKLDEFSMPINGENSPVDQETGVHESDPVTSEQEDANAGNVRSSGHGVDRTLGIGIQYPGIQINDWIASQRDILKMELSCSGFVPTIRIELQVNGTDLMKRDLCKEGDHINLFMAPGHGMLKSLRLDFLITTMVTPKFKQYDLDGLYHYTLFGELNIPGLYNNTGFAFSGTSRDALVDVAKKLNLGFIISDDENTNDSQMWYCVTEDDQQDYAGAEAVSSTIKGYIEDTISHAWKSENSFYDGWIDFRYCLAFIDVNRILGASGHDEAFDLTFFNNVFMHNRVADNKHGTLTDQEKKENPQPQIKIITNIPQDEESATAFYAIDFKVIDRAHEITREIGTQMQSVIGIQNQGVSDGQTDVNMAYSIIYNPDKYNPENPKAGGYYIMMGPGTPENHKAGDNVSYVNSNLTIQGSGTLQDTQSDDDGDNISATGDNMQACGNTNKFYDAAQQHNYINNQQLRKKYMKVTLNGANFALMRGEKIPVIMLDNNKLQSFIGSNATDDTSTGQGLSATDQQRINKLNQILFTDESGWFMIQSVKYIYTVDNYPGMSNWMTELVLTRREWPIPGYCNVFAEDDGNVYVNVSEITSSSSQSSISQTTGDEIDEYDESLTDGQQTTNGLESYMQSLYTAIVEATEAVGGSIKLVGARRWAIDEEGNKIDGAAYVEDASGTYMLCIDTTNVIMYIKPEQRQNMHLFGRAIDIMPGDGISMDDLLTKVLLVDPAVLSIMYNNGISCFKESTISAGQSVQHYHIGTNTGREGVWWGSVKVANGNTETLQYGTQRINLNNYQQFLKQAPTAVVKNEVKITSDQLSQIQAKYQKS